LKHLIHHHFILHPLKLGQISFSLIGKHSSKKGVAPLGLESILTSPRASALSYQMPPLRGWCIWHPSCCYFP